MEKRTMYFLFTDTGTSLARLINFFTKRSLNHVSISFDHELREVYSFGRKKPRNPFIGGFVKEDIRSSFLKDSACAIYVCNVTETDYKKIMQEIKKVEKEKNAYRYNFIGLLGVLLQIEIDREYAMFCSQFVATVTRDIQAFQFEKPPCFVTPADIREKDNLEMIYQGQLSSYQDGTLSRDQLTQEEETTSRQSFIFQLSRKVKNLVVR